MSDKIYTLRLDAADMCLIGGGLAMLALMGGNTATVRMTLDEVRAQLAEQGLELMLEMARQSKLAEIRETKRDRI